ncbi:MAG: hypothetical protein MZV70_61905 [Desulfobacterales bacterium]|nr:hypothetical protein [Desulfobacterales bacterium]
MHHIETIPYLRREPIDQEIHKDMPPVPGCNWDTKPYYNRTAKANQLKGADDRVPKKPQHNVSSP